jgi:drug/metabolite transporter (DMT)-like permease
VKFKKLFIYLAIACCNGTGDVLLKRGMDNLGEIHLNHWTHIFNAFIDPWIILGILFLAGFFYSYLTALSWADLTFVLPATAFGYVVTAFLSRVFLHETVSPWRWAGVLLITCGVGLVARGPSLTERHTKDPALTEGTPPGKDSAHAKHTLLSEDAKLAKDSALAKDTALTAKEQHEPA